MREKRRWLCVCKSPILLDRTTRIYTIQENEGRENSTERDNKR